MRRDVQEIFKMTPHDKQVMMFSATLSKEIRPVCKKFMQDPMEIYVDDEAKLTLHGLVQHYIKLSELEKNRKLKSLHSDISLVELANETVKEDDRAVLLEWGGLQSASPKARSSPVTSHVVRFLLMDETFLLENRLTLRAMFCQCPHLIIHTFHSVSLLFSSVKYVLDQI
ncbi:hypothetical protein CsSME_00021687 [Camellia sinensis var. sinensis]